MIKKKVCPDCEGQGKIHFVSENRFEPCNTCWYKGYIEVPMTNADYIRSMSDEELAELLYDIYCDGIDSGECAMLDMDVEFVNIDGLKQWMQEEYEENGLR